MQTPTNRSLSTTIYAAAEKYAQAWRSEFTDAEFVLLALIDLGLVDALLSDAVGGAAAVRGRIEQYLSAPEAEVELREPSTPSCRHVMEYAWRLAKAEGLPGDDALPSHYLLGLLHDEEGLATQILRRAGVTVETVRARMVSP